VEFGPFGLSEIIFIALLALVVFGPRRLPEIGHQLGMLTAKLRRATADLRRAWESELDEDSRKAVTDATRQLRDLRQEFTAVGLETWRQGASVADEARAAVHDAARSVVAPAAELPLPRSSPPPPGPSPVAAPAPPPPATGNGGSDERP
jgi:sec-independent protein translocase protein TatB